MQMKFDCIVLIVCGLLVCSASGQIAQGMSQQQEQNFPMQPEGQKMQQQGLGLSTKLGLGLDLGLNMGR
ncbi:hypothetical protein WA026_019868 [Henosepilachna vigintioctopunctata]|uniref:Uncharacterized protein n=1 Tax=Henosepilachna vigintioctopunctata TaxID=420089 RepID=A0AAW1VB41_9CUCU